MQSKYSERWGVGLMYSTLTQIDENLQPYPDLATEWETNDAIDQWTFTLRDDAVFSYSGNTVTASDVKATFDAVADPDIGNNNGKGTMGPIEEVQALDETTVQFNLGGATPDFPMYVAKRWASVIPKTVIDDESMRQQLSEKDFGSGPYNLQEFTPGDHLTVIRNEDYYLTDEDGNQLPYADKVTQKAITQISPKINALKNMETDVMTRAPPGNMNSLQQAEGINARSVPSGSYVYLAMNTETEPFSDNRVRKAFKLAIDREVFKNISVSGWGTIGNDTVLSPAYKYYNEDLPQREQDLEKAKSLLADAGYPDGFDLEEDFGITYYSPNAPETTVRTAVLFKSQLSKIGVNLPLEQVSSDYYLSNVLAQAPCYTGFVGMRFTEDDFFTLILTSDAPYNETAFSDDEFDELINQARQTVDETERAQLYGEAQRILYERGPYVIPVHPDRTSATRTYVGNYEPNPLPFFYHPESISLGMDAPTR